MKYKARRVIGCPACGFNHDSQTEAARCMELHIQRQQGMVAHIDIFPVVTLAKGMHWKLDFLVFFPDGTARYEDVKGMQTADFKLKRKLYDVSRSPIPLAVLKGRKSRKGVWTWEEI